MGIAEHLLGRQLPGRLIPGDWVVLERVDHSPKSSEGCCSVGYKVQHENGRKAFMKASDLHLLTDDHEGPFIRMQAAVRSQEFERAILEHCRGNRMDRVVVALDYGDIIEVHEGTREPLFYLIFELAACDARVQVNLLKRFDFAWSLHALHNVAVAVSQLHSAKVSHNDIKPSNILVFDRLLQKLGDLGRATSPIIPSIHDEEICVGDPRYAAPETLYGPKALTGR